MTISASSGNKAADQGHMGTVVRALIMLALFLPFFLIAFIITYVIAAVMADGAFFLISILIHLHVHIPKPPTALEWPGDAVWVTLPLPLAVVFFVKGFWRGAPVPSEGVLVDRQRAAELWTTVRGLAAAVQTRAPDEIRLIADANAMVAERTSMLGLRSSGSSEEHPAPTGRLAGKTSVPGQIGTGPGQIPMCLRLWPL